MEHEGSILYGPVNALWHSAQHRYGWDIPDHVIMSALVLVICSIVFPLATRRLSRENPGPFQHMLELAVQAGCELQRPAKVTALELGADRSYVTYETSRVSTRWLVDASGRGADPSCADSAIERLGIAEPA